MARPINTSDRGTVAPAHRDGPSGQNNSAFGFYTAKVMNNIDALKLNRMQIHVPAFGGAETDPNSWITAKSLTPHGGATPNPGSNQADFEKVQKAYGTFTPAPDIGTQVTVAFLNGDLGQPVVIGTMFQDNLTHSLPGIGTGKYKDKDGNVVEGPVTEHNHTNETDQPTERVRHRVLDDSLKKQGLDQDPFRGFSSSTSQRESPSRVHGTLTRGQQQFVMDDGDTDGNNRLIRLRTRNGAQIVLHDSCGFVYMANKDGTAWVELGADGSFSVFGAGHINLHAMGDLNLAAQGAVNIEGNDINMRSRTGDIRMQSVADIQVTGENVNTTAKKNANLLVTGNYKETAQKIDMNGPKADEAKLPALNDLSVNKGYRQGVVTAAPEAEPWGGHGSCGDSTGKNSTQNSDSETAEGVPESAATAVGNNTSSALPPGQQTTLPGKYVWSTGVSAIGGQTVAGTLGGVLGSAIQQVTGIGTQGVLGTLARASANVLGVPADGLLSNPKAGVQSDPDRYGEYPRTPTSRTTPPGKAPAGTGNASTQPGYDPSRNAGEVPPRPSSDTSCEKGPTTDASSVDIYGTLLIMTFEAYRGVAYLDPTVWASIGYGFSMRDQNHWAYKKAIDVNGGLTEDEAWTLINEYIQANQGQFARNIGGPVPQNVFNGLASFWYQNGGGRQPGVAGGRDMGPLRQLVSQKNWNGIAQLVRSHPGEASRRNLEAQLIANGCYPKYIVSKGSAKIREERVIEGIRSLAQGLRNPGGYNGNRGWQGRVGSSGPSTGMNEVTAAQARRLLFQYSGDPRTAVADAAKRSMGGGTG